MKGHISQPSLGGFEKFKENIVDNMELSMDYVTSTYINTIMVSLAKYFKRNLAIKMAQPSG